ncbi:MAG: L-aspartate oxidase [Caldilineaceae bacterium]
MITQSTDLIETDVLIIGTGVAGCTTALTLADAGVAVTVVTRGRAPQDSNTYWAQGGIIYQGANDSPELLAADVERAGAGHCYPKAVQILAEQGPASVRRVLLERTAVAFDRSQTGDLSLALEGGHTIPRIIHAADATGKAIEIALLNALRAHPNITLLTGHTAIDLLTPSYQGRNRLLVYEPRNCVGAYLLDQERGQVIRCLARKTVLATGGLGQIFLRTTNPAGARGDGLAMAYRAGVHTINAEFVQFHPTTFYARNGARFLVSEAVRGAGARLVHADGEPFMDQYAPEWKDLAPRDVVARSIHKEMLQRDLPNVYLDLRSYIDRAEILDHFPTIYERSLEFGVDITTDLVPVVPAAHYFCGGIRVDEWGRTTRRDLYAVGEVACTGVHGANRLASTSLLEGLVWGERAAQHIHRQLADTEPFAADEIPPWQSAGSESADPALISQDMSSIKHIMWNYVGLVRTAHELERAQREVTPLGNRDRAILSPPRVTDELIGLRNAVRAAIIVADAATRNRESVGCHYRE